MIRVSMQGHYLRAYTGPIGHSISISLCEFIGGLILGVILYYTVSATFIQQYFIGPEELIRVLCT